MPTGPTVVLAGIAGGAGRYRSDVPTSRSVLTDQLSWSVREVGRAVDTAALFEALFGAEPVAFWLDSSLAVPGLSRISVLGTTAGPDAEVLVRDVADGDVFAELWSRLATRVTAGPPPRLPFTGGYVGWFGYELKALTGGAAVHTSPAPDALWIWANRFAVVDPVLDRTWLVVVHNDLGRAGAEDWLAAAERVATRDDVVGREGAAGGSAVLDDGVRREGAAGGSAVLDEGVRQEGAAGGSGVRDGGVPLIAGLDIESRLELPREQYLAAIGRVREALEAGESYEVCLTNRVRLPAVPDPLGFYLWQRRRNPAPYAAFIRYGDLAVASSSPERFLTVDADGWAECRPIKGTAPRSADPEEDRAAAKRLAADEKTRAENLMIADLIRNDLGRVCEPGTMRVPKLMAVESYATMHQLVTTVRGRLRAGVDALEAVRACFPPGSMTGAPKIRTMEIIDELEPSARGVYSGALGYLGLDGQADLSVVIRTAVMTRQETVVGAGGAIVLDSVAEDEYDEMLLKATAAVRGRDA